MFVYEGHRVKVKVTGADNVQHAYSGNVNFDRPYGRDFLLIVTGILSRTVSELSQLLFKFRTLRF